MKRHLAVIAVLTVLTAACTSSAPGAVVTPGDLPLASAQDISEFVAADGRPAVVNVWASWCGPCRAEAPLLREAHAEYGDRVLFIGVDIQDSQESAKAFIEEFGLEFQHFFDPNRDIPVAWGGLGVPLTYFLSADGEVVALHNGILDERTLVEGLEGLLANS